MRGKVVAGLSGNPAELLDTLDAALAQVRQAKVARLTGRAGSVALWASKTHKPAEARTEGRPAEQADDKGVKRPFN
jgi:hypothetical protein